jgi:adenylate kinase family enzyme
MNSKISSASRILILGDSGIGKTTLAEKLSKILLIPTHSTDDFYWATKFSVKRDPAIALAKINAVYSTNNWIVEGSTQKLTEPGYAQADVILYLSFKNIFWQWWCLVKRHNTRNNESLKDIFLLMRHVFYKKYNLGYMKGKPRVLDLLKPFHTKLIVINTHKEIDKLIEN